MQKLAIWPQALNPEPFSTRYVDVPSGREQLQLWLFGGFAKAEQLTM